MSTSGFSAEIQRQVDVATKRLREGGIVIYPTETFYGIGAVLSRPEALSRLASLKGRKSEKPLPVIVAGEDEARALWKEVPPLVEGLMKRFWPGPLTIVLPARAGLPFEVAPHGAIGVRVSSNEIARALAKSAGAIVATSANLAGQRECTRVAEIDPSLRGEVDAVVDVGETVGGRPSTVVTVEEGKLTVLREGAVQRVLIENCVGKST